MLLTYLAHIILLAVLVTALLCVRRHSKQAKYKLSQLNSKWLIITAIGYFGYLFIDRNRFSIIDFNLLKPQISTLIPNWPTLWWHWDVTVTAVIYSFFIILLISKFDANQENSKKPNQQLKQQLGLTFKQHKNSLKPCLIIFGILLVARYYLSLIVGGDDGVRDPEELLFLLIAEGSDKTLFFFSLLPVLFSRTFTYNPIVFRHKLYEINLTHISSALLFAIFNGLNTISPIHNLIFISSFLLMGIYALVFLWMKQITGSLVMPLVCYGVLMFFSQLL